MVLWGRVKVNVIKLVSPFIQKPIPVSYIGEGKIVKAAEILYMNGVSKVLIVTDSAIKELGLLDSMLKAIENKNIKTVIYEGVKPDPTFGIVDEAIEICRKEKCKAVIAVGGGSVIDTAKAVSISIANNKPPRKFVGMLKIKKRPLFLIAIPTTAGTGSECTLAAVISDTDTHKKSVIIDPKVVPMVAILDPDITLGLPLSITANTGMDALTHALEAYVSRYATEETDSYARIAIKVIYESLEESYKEPKNIKLRESMLVASFYAGLAFTRTQVGYVHAFAHSVGGKYGVPHGLANAVILPHIMEYYKTKPMCEKRFASLADIVGIKGENQKVKSDRFVESIFGLNENLGIKDRLENFPKEGIDTILKMGFKEAHGTYPVPKYLNKKVAREILSKVAMN